MSTINRIHAPPESSIQFGVQFGHVLKMAQVSTNQLMTFRCTRRKQANPRRKNNGKLQSSCYPPQEAHQCSVLLVRITLCESSNTYHHHHHHSHTHYCIKHTSSIYRTLTWLFLPPPDKTLTSCVAFVAIMAIQLLPPHLVLSVE